MKKIIYNKFDKTEIHQLPVVEFQGRIVVVYTEIEARKAVDFLLAQPILGFDTETRPSFKKGSVHKVALMQVSTPDTCFLFRLNQIHMTPDIISLLEDTTVPKIGLSLNDDILSLHRNTEFTPGLFIDLQDHMREIGIEDLSLQKLYANLFRQRISKNQRLTNWEAQILSDRQKIYAATDAWACINIYREYLRLVQTGDYELVIIPEPDSQVSDIQ